MAEITVNTSNNQVILTQNTTNVVQVNTPGPRGNKGLTGEIGPAAPAGALSGSLYLTGSLGVSSSFVDFTNSTAISGSTFSGSFVGDGSGLTGIDTPFTHITASGNISASGFISASSIHIAASGPSSLTINSGDNDNAVHISSTDDRVNVRLSDNTTNTSKVVGVGADTNDLILRSDIGGVKFRVGGTDRIDVFEIDTSGNVDTSGNISSSGFISASSFSGDGSGLTNVPSTTTIPAGTYSSSLQTLGNITSSGDISASGNIIGTDISASSIHIAASGPNSLTVNSGDSDTAVHIFSTDDRVNVRLSDNTSNTTKIVGVGADGNDLILRSDIGGVKFLTGGTDRIPVFEIDASGNVSASGDLIINNITSSGDILLDEDQRIFFEADKNTYIESHASDSFRAVVNNRQMFLLDEDTGNRAVFGNGTKVFIGANNNHLPLNQLEVSGSVSIFGGGTAGGHITASGDISASGDINANTFSVDGNELVNYHTDDGFRFNSGTKPLTLFGNVTASGNISASGTGSFENLKLDYDTIPTSDPSIKGVVYRSSSAGIDNLLFISAGS